MSSNDYDSGRSRRRRRVLSEVDDAWAAAHEDDVYDDSADIEDLAAGYVDDPPRRRAGADWDDDFAASMPSRRRRRPPTYYRDRMSRGEYGEYHADRQRTLPPPRTGFILTVPFWQILIIVILALAALFATALACISLLLI